LPAKQKSPSPVSPKTAKLKRESLDRRLRKALSHALRARILALAHGRPWSLRELADELGENRGKVRYHVKVLRRLELIEQAQAGPRRISTEHYYIAVTAPSSDAADSSLSPVPSPVAIPSPTSQEFVLVRRSEIDRLKRSTKRAFADPAGNASGWAYTWLGIGVGALLSLGGLVGVKRQAVATGVVAGDVALAFIGLFLAGYLLWFDRHAGRQSTTETDLVAELDELDRRAPTTVPAD